MTLSPDNYFSEILPLDPSMDERVIRHAFEVASQAHHDQVRASGEPYLVHPCAVARTVAQLQQGTEAIAAALLHDAVEDGGVTPADIEGWFGAEVATLVSALSKMTSLELPHREARQIEYLRRLLLALADDARVIVIKLADRHHNMETLSFLPPERRRATAAETLEVYAPLAHRLGMGWFRVRLEDLAFKELDPESYQQIKNLVAARREERESMVNALTVPLREALAMEAIEAEISGRAKHFYGIYRKMRLQGKSFEEIYDLVGLRVVCPSVEDCYRALGVVHTLWTPLSGRMKDYVAVPKPNMYRSIHTTMHTDSGAVVELQIRTKVMDAIAEFGVAAHWRYHMDQTGDRYVLGDHFQWFQRVLDAHAAGDDPHEIVGAFRNALLDAEVMVLTPRGELIPLRAGSTALDFAFAVHTEVGLHCAGVRVNGKAVPMDYRLHSGDQVEVTTSPSSHPTMDWLNRATGPGAKQKIRRFLRSAERERQQAVGRTLLLKHLRGMRMTLPRTLADWEDLARRLQYNTPGELWVGTALGAVGRTQLEALRSAPEPPLPAPKEPRPHAGVPRGVRLGDLRGIAVRFAQCCRPIPGDPIAALVTRGRGASVHHAECPNAFRGDPERWTLVEWDVAEGESFTAYLTVRVSDRRSMLGDVESAIQGVGARLSGLDFIHGARGAGRLLLLLVVVSDTAHLDRVLVALKRIPGTVEARRGREAAPLRTLRRPS